MSLWINKKRHDGSGSSDILLLPIAEMMLPAVILLVMIITLGLSGALLLTGFGFVLSLIAKLSLFAKGINVSWGSKSMSSIFRTCYRVGYGLMIAGLMAALFSLKISG